MEKDSIKESILLRIASIILIILGFSWIGYLIFKDREAISVILNNLSRENVFWLIGSLLLGSLSIFFYFLVFKRILVQNTGKSVRFSSTANLYFGSQVVRYLPGRFFGIVYQVSKTRKLFAPELILKTNIEFILLSELFNTLFSICILIFFKVNYYLSIFLLITIFLFIYLYLRLNLAYLFLAALGKLFPKRMGKYLIRLKPSCNFNLQSITYIIGIFLLVWGFYLMAWLALKNVLPGYENVNMIVLCAKYYLAFIVGFIVIIIPAGLGVRESIFVLLSKGTVNSSVLAFSSIFLRFWLMAIDLILFSGFFIFQLFRSALKKNK